MAVTPDLAPGARARVWILLTLTALGGGATYAVFERTEILWIAGLLLAVLLYLLLGVRLTLGFERRALAPVIEHALAALGPDGFWVLLDPGGTVLRLSAAGERALGHPASVLEGQRLADLVPMREAAARVALAELLRQGSLGGEWRGALPLLDERGVQRTVALRTVPIGTADARRAGLIALFGQAA